MCPVRTLKFLVARGGIDQGLRLLILTQTISKKPKNGMGWAMASVVSYQGKP